MNGRTASLLLRAGFLTLLNTNLFAQERWVYCYDGPAAGEDAAKSIVMGSDSNIYAAGYSSGIGTSYDLTVVSLTDSGTDRWIYRYDGPASERDEARSIIMGLDGNLYVAGSSTGGGTTNDFAVVSVDPSGGERWFYRYKGPANRYDGALSAVMGPDGNLYAIGFSSGIGTSWDFTVVSLTDSGVERWVYRYNGAADTFDCATSIAVGLDSNIYAAGYSYGNGTSSDFIVVSLTSSGAERWVYRYNGPGNDWDEARSIVLGSDGNLYAAGSSTGIGTSDDFTVVSLDSSGAERWVYRYDGPGSDWDVVYSVAVGSDANLYAAGWSRGSGTQGDLTVVSLTDSGTERWVYRYDSPDSWSDGAYSIIVGPDGNLYAAGASDRSATSRDFTVASVSSSGFERWVYGYNGPGNDWDEARSIVMGLDGNLYVAGSSDGYGAGSNFTVISLSPDVGVEEKQNRFSVPDFHLLQSNPNPFHNSTLISYSLPIATNVTLAIYDITGRLVEALVNETQEPGIHQVEWDRKTNPSGVYFYRLKAGEFEETRKMVVVE